MIKYYNTMVVFEEIPDEITLAINITNCPCHCPGCHSKFLWEDIGTELTTDELDKLILDNKGITCVCFMGGDAEPEGIQQLANHILETCDDMKVAWYSGKDEVYDGIDLGLFDYVKIGRYDERFGGLDNPNTNQKLYKTTTDFEGYYGYYKLEDITYKFWKKK